MTPGVSGRRLLAGGLLLLLGLVASAALLVDRAFAERVEWDAWSRPADLPDAGPWRADFTNFVTLRFEDVAGADIELRRGRVAPKWKPVTELRWSADDGERTVASDLGAGNGELRIGGALRPGRAFLVGEAGTVTPDPDPPADAIERFFDR